MSGGPDDGWIGRVREARALLLDFDGTLAPNLNLPDLRRRVVALVQQRGVPERAFADRYIVEALEASADWLDEHDPAAADALRRDGHRLIRDFELAAARTTRPFDDTRDTLGALCGHGLALAVVTRNCRDAVLTVFPDLLDYCGVLLARDDVRHLKPDERHLQQALDAVGHPADAAVMVGDAALDMLIGKSLGLCCLGVLTGSSDAERLRQAGADAVLAGIGDLLQIPARP